MMAIRGLASAVALTALLAACAARQDLAPEFAGTPSPAGCDGFLSIGGTFSTVDDVRFRLSNRSTHPRCRATRAAVIFRSRLPESALRISTPSGWTPHDVPCSTGDGSCGVEWRSPAGITAGESLDGFGLVFVAAATPRLDKWILDVGRRTVTMPIGTVGSRLSTAPENPRGDSPAAAAQDFRVPDELGWVGLYSAEMIEWLENGNRIDSLCGNVKGDDGVRCREERLRPKPFVLSLYTGPERAAAAGSLLLLATPREGMRWFFAPPNGVEAREFETDLAMQDWGYGPYYHQTYLERRGTWFLLPRDPFPAPVWFNAADLGDEPHVLGLLEVGIVEDHERSLVVIRIEQGHLIAREEQPADMWCESGEPPPLKAWTELRIPRRELYDARGHLRFRPAYMKGC